MDFLLDTGGKSAKSPGTRSPKRHLFIIPGWTSHYQLMPLGLNHLEMFPQHAWFYFLNLWWNHWWRNFRLFQLFYDWWILQEWPATSYQLQIHTMHILRYFVPPPYKYPKINIDIWIKWHLWRHLTHLPTKISGPQFQVHLFRAAYTEISCNIPSLKLT